MSLGKMLKQLEGQVVCYSILLIRDWDPRKRSTEQLNDWLHGWCHVQGFGFNNLGCTFKRLAMLTWYRMHLTRWDKTVHRILE